MMSEISASPGVTSSFTSVGFERAGLPPSTGWCDTRLVSKGSLERAESFSYNAENGLVCAVVGAFGSLAVDVLLVPVLDMIEEEGLEYLYIFLLFGLGGCEPLPCLLDGLLDSMHGGQIS